MSDQVKAGILRGSPEVAYITDGSGRTFRVGAEGKAEEVTNDHRAFTWKDARAIAVIVRDGLLMIVKGIERTFDLGAKK